MARGPSNDYKNNYFHPQLYPTSCIYSLEQYAQAVIEELWKFDYDGQALHNLGVRKYVLAGLGRIGCTPTVMHSHGTNGSCVEEQNAAISNYNNKLKALVDQFNDRELVDPQLKGNFPEEEVQIMAYLAEGVFPARSRHSTNHERGRLDYFEYFPRKM
ncbi:GDSL esterase/lipase [Glycine soja]|uniref:GDSL esterase/lipase n=1 Tax=Glycine soja TaxID=3848 RepID=A0A0B2S208_GLYSO|nr:GDSL esterase/lipase [Glycine soja]